MFYSAAHIRDCSDLAAKTFSRNAKYIFPFSKNRKTLTLKQRVRQLSGFKVLISIIIKRRIPSVLHENYFSASD